MRPSFVVGASMMAALIVAGSASRADDVQHTGQSQQTQGVSSSVPSNPAQGDRPAYPGDQPAKEGMDRSSQVHNVDPRDLEGKTHKER